MDWFSRAFLSGDGFIHRPLRLACGSGEFMTPMVWVGALVAFLVVGYLIYVLLHAERF
jgi:K+-transporting ATPase KdpF subunit